MAKYRGYTRSDPAISSIPYRDQDSLLRTPFTYKGAGCPIITSVIYCSPSGCPRSPVRTELVQLAVVAALAPHPAQMDGQLSRHRDFRDLPPAPHSQMEKLAADCPP